MPLPSRQGLVHAGAICMGMKLGPKGNAEGIRYYILLPVARQQQQPPSLYNSGTSLLLEWKVSKQLANCNSHCLLAIIRRTAINSNRWNSDGSVSFFFPFFFHFSSPKGICYELNDRFDQGSVSRVPAKLSLARATLSSHCPVPIGSEPATYCRSCFGEPVLSRLS